MNAIKASGLEWDVYDPVAWEPLTLRRFCADGDGFVAIHETAKSYVCNLQFVDNF